MTRRYSIAPAAKAGVNTANTVMWQLRAAALRCFVRQVGIFVVTAPTTAPAFVIARATATGATPTTAAPVSHDPSTTAATTLLDTAWGTAPTFTTAGPHARLIGLPVAAGNGAILPFEVEPFEINPTSGLVVANLNASGATLGSFGLFIEFEE